MKNEISCRYCTALSIFIAILFQQLNHEVPCLGAKLSNISYMGYRGITIKKSLSLEK